MSKVEKKRELFEQFLESSKIVVVDKSSAFLRRIVKILVDMGAQRHSIFSVTNCSDAKEVIDSERPNMIISDFSINGGSAFELFKDYKESQGTTNDIITILLTSNTSQSIVARAAEEDVDAFIIKPFTVASIEMRLVNIVVNKLHPSDYIEKIEEGKKKILDEDYENAFALFDEARSLSDRPSLALFYHGKTHHVLKEIREAEDDYYEGLSVNGVHFKCQIGLYNIFKDGDRYYEAYNIIRNITKYFPGNSKRLKEIVYLAVITGNLEHVKEYYDIFREHHDVLVDIEDRDKEVVKYVCIGMYIAGKYFFRNGNDEAGKEHLNKAIISCRGSRKVLINSIKELSSNKLFDESRAALKQFHSDERSSDEYKISNFLANVDGMETNEVVLEATNLNNSGIRDPEVFRHLISKLYEEDNRERGDEYLEEAISLWPDQFKRSA